jgi:anti-sigma-K factor RskA
MSEPALDQERDLLAAEYALGLLDAETREQAARLLMSDPGFRRAVEGWEERLAGLADEIVPVAPPDTAWSGIERTIRDGRGESNVVQLRRRIRLWQGLAGAAGALAASLAIIVAIPRDAPAPAPAPVSPAPQPRTPMLVAGLAPTGEAKVSLTVAFEAPSQSLLVRAAELDRPAGRDHQLWIIPAGGRPVSLGLVRQGGPQRLAIAPEVAPHFRSDATIALSLEPAGGSATGQPTGPVVAAAPLIAI